MSIKTAALATSIVALLGVLIQMGAIAAITNFSCRSEVDSYPATLSATVLTPGRRLLVNSSEIKARCSFAFSMDWWSVFYQFGVTVAALVTVRAEDVLMRTRTRIGILFAIAVVWVVLRANITLVSSNVLTLQNNLRDAGVSESDYKAAATIEQYGLYTSYRAYAAGTVISAISYFLYIVLVLAEDEAVPSAKAAEAEEA